MFCQSQKYTNSKIKFQVFLKYFARSDIIDGHFFMNKSIIENFSCKWFRWSFPKNPRCWRELALLPGPGYTPFCFHRPGINQSIKTLYSPYFNISCVSKKNTDFLLLQLFVSFMFLIECRFWWFERDIICLSICLSSVSWPVSCHEQSL